MIISKFLFFRKTLVNNNPKIIIFKGKQIGQKIKKIYQNKNISIGELTKNKILNFFFNFSYFSFSNKKKVETKYIKNIKQIVQLWATNKYEDNNNNIILKIILYLKDIFKNDAIIIMNKIIQTYRYCISIVVKTTILKSIIFNKDNQLYIFSFIRKTNRR